MMNDERLPSSKGASLKPQASSLINRLTALAATLARPVSVMEVCGTHTMSIYRQGIRSLLPENLRLISGPGCPVCVTPSSTIDRMIWLASAQSAGRCIATFGDMIRVPGTEESLQQARSKGADVRVVYSPMDSVKLAAEMPDRQVVLLGVGFETTAPGIAAAVLEAERQALDNWSLATAFKLVPPALEALLGSADQTPAAVQLDGLLCPGHVSVIIGSEAYRPIVEKYHMPCVIAGFDGLEILDGLVGLLEQIQGNEARVENRYPIWVKPQGNQQARALLDQVFTPVDAEWRGLGVIPGSGLALHESFERFDAFKRFDVPALESREPKGCRCGEILQGAIRPEECKLFGKVCTPDSPIGPCMVSSEGTCAAAYRYG